MSSQISLVRIALGLLTGFILWLIWQASAITSPELESIKLRFFVAGVSQTHAAATGAPHSGYTLINNWRGLLPLACLLSVLFAISKPLPRFFIWLFTIAAASATAIYCFQTFKYIVPWGGPLIVLNCFYLCGTLIYLETEKIERNRALAIDLQMEAENERKRVAKELHDESLQSLSRLIRLADTMHAEDEANPAPVELRSRLESCITEMRRIINDLHPSALEEFGLVLSIENLVEELKRSSGIKIVFSDQIEGARFDPFTELSIFRIVQEALNNIEKHANASEAQVSIARAENKIRIQISDNGVGAPSRKPNSHGIRNITDRAKLIGAKLEWKVPQIYTQGTELLLTIPLKLESAFSKGNSRAADNS